jgi:DNA-binding CsgD family transcriptional regulator
MSDDAATEYDIALAKTPAPVPALPPEMALIEALQDAGCIVPDPQRAIAVLEPILDRIGDERAADALHAIFSRLKGKKGEEIKLALLGTMGKSLKQSADGLGVSKQTLFTNIQRIRRRIFGKTSDGLPLCSES